MMIANDDDSLVLFDFMKQQVVEERKDITEGDDSELTCLHSIELTADKSKADSSDYIKTAMICGDSKGDIRIYSLP